MSALPPVPHTNLTLSPPRKRPADADASVTTSPAKRPKPAYPRPASPPPRKANEPEHVRLWDIDTKGERALKVRGTQSNVVAWAQLRYTNSSVTINANDIDPVLLIDGAAVDCERRLDAELRSKQEATKHLWNESEFGPAVTGLGTPAEISLWVNGKNFKI